MVLRKTLSLFVCLFVALISLAAHAQQPAGAAAATVHGTVTDPDNALIPGATVTLTPAKGKAIIVQSGSDGVYTAHGVAPGTYTMTVTMTGFATFVRENIHLTGQSTAIDVKMALQVESQQIQVTAQSAQVSVDSDSNASSTVIKGKDLDALSDDPDELSSELSALAGPSAGPNGGQIYVDGFTGGQLPPKSSIREIRINQNPFSAQYDKLGYGRVEVFTKPGTDKYHGNFSMQGGDKSFNTSNPFLGPSNTQPDYHTIFMFGNLSGPINHFSSFSVGGSHRDIEDNSIVNPGGFYASSPTSTTPCKPGVLTCTYYNSYPVANRAVAHPQTRSDISPRLDLALGEKNTLTFRYQYEVSDVQNAGVGNTSLPTVGYNSHSNENTIQISDTQIVSSRVINETRFEYQRAASSTDPLDKTPTLSVQGIFTAGGSSQGTQRSNSTHIEVQNYTSVALEKNFLRLGARMRTNSQSTTSDQGANGTFTYSYLLDPCTDPNQTKRPSSCNPAATVPCAASNATGYISSYQCGTPGQFAITKINNATISGRVTDIGLYAEDDWKIKPNLTLTLGARYEAQNVIHSNHDFAPRIAFAWGIPRAGGKSPMTVIRGGYGIFYDRFGLGNYLNTLQLNGINQQRSTFINPGSACTPDNPANCGSSAPSRTTLYNLGSGIRSSYTLQAAVGIDQQLGRAATMSVNYLNARGVHQFLTRNFYDPTVPGQAPPTTPYNYQYQSGGVFRQNQLMFNGRAALRNANLFGFYAISFADANTSGAGFIPTSNTNTKVDYGRATFAFRQFGVFGGSVNLPYLVTLSPFMIAQAGTPYNIISGTDPLGSSIYNTRPYFANGNSGNCAVASDFSATQTGSLTPVPINYCTGPANVSINLRVAKVFGFGPKTGAAAAGGGQGGGPGGGRRGGPGGGGGGRGGGGPMGMGGPSSGHRYSLTLGAQASNLFNMVPYGTPTSSLSSPRFGQFTTLSTGPFSSQTAVRRIMLQATFNF